MLRFTKERREDQQGAIIPLLALMLISVLTVIGLAIDSGNLYTASLTLQKAADAGALAGAKFIAMQSRDFIRNQEPDARLGVKSRTIAIFRTNLQVSVLDAEIGDLSTSSPGDRITIDVASKFYNTSPAIKDGDTVTVDATWRVPLYLLRYLPGFGQDSLVRVSSRAQVQPSIVSLLLDTSGSMLCPDNGAPCDCYPLCEFTPGIVVRALRLKYAVADFVSRFNPERDMFHMAFFATGSQTIIPIHPDGGYDFAAIRGVLTNFPIGGATNICDALLNGWIGTLPATNPPRNRHNVAYLLFSDGAPNVARFFFARPTNLPVNNRLGQPWSAYDYYSWASNFRDPADPVQDLSKPPTLPLVSSAQQLAAANIPYYWQHGEVPGDPTVPPPPIDPVLYQSTDKRVACSVANVTNPSVPFNSCLADFSFATPDGQFWGAGVPFTDYRKQYYNCAIAMADALRNLGGVVYAIGLGAPPDPGLIGDAYQEALNDSDRKDHFFDRLSNTPDTEREAAVWKFPGKFGKYEPTVSLDVPALGQGRYVSMDTADTLDKAFQKLFQVIVRKVKTVQLVK